MNVWKAIDWLAWVLLCISVLTVLGVMLWGTLGDPERPPRYGKFKEGGHIYVEKLYGEGKGAFVHDPDCPCHALRGNIEITR